MLDYIGWRAFAEILLLPPANLLVLMLAAALLWPRRPRLAAGLLGLAAGLLLLFSLPLFSGVLLRTLEDVPPLDPATLAGRSDAAIVVLSGDLLAAAPEYGGDTVGGYTLERMRYGARLHRATGLPILVSGGVVRRDTISLAETMREAYEKDFGITVRWLEDRSRTTLENAVFSAPILRDAGIRTAVIVTHAWHMKRSLDAFETTGLEAVAAPTIYTREPGLDAQSLLPRPMALTGSYFALHEWIGRLWYRLLRGQAEEAARAKG
jgi:uncharacterized SAM-binding protein YcdF (DUF218 family)